MPSADLSIESAAAEKHDIVDSQYQISDAEKQNFFIKVVTCVVAVFGFICLITLLYIGIRLLSSDAMGASHAASKLNRSDDSGHIMIGACSSPEIKLAMEPKYYIAAGHGSATAKNIFATNVTPSGGLGGGAGTAASYQPLTAKSAGGVGKYGGDQLTALEYQLLAPELVSKLEKGGQDEHEEAVAADRLLKPMISCNSSFNNNNNNNSNNNCRNPRINKNHINNNFTSSSSNKVAVEDCHCLAKNCRNCCGTKTKFSNDLWRGKK